MKARHLVFLCLLLLSIPQKSVAQNSWNPAGPVWFTNVPDTDILAIYNDTVSGLLYVGGQFTHIGGVAANNIAVWDGSTWSAMGTGIDSIGTVQVESGIFSICRYNGDIYAAGFFPSFNNTVYNNIARWDGSNWQPVGGGVTGDPVASGIYDMCVYNGELYVGGKFAYAGNRGAGGVARWNGSEWHCVKDSITIPYFTFALCVYDSMLIMGGNFNNIDTGTVFDTHRIIGWNAYRQRWVTLDSISSSVYELYVHNGDLYAGGYFSSYPGSHVARWDGQDWHPLGLGVDGYVLAMTSYNNELIVGGQFWNAGSLPVNYIAAWDGTAWHDLDGGFSAPGALFWAEVDALGTYQGRLWAGGWFNQASGNTCTKLAVWPNSPLGISSTASVTGSYAVQPIPATDVLQFISSSNQVSDEFVGVELYDLTGRLVIQSHCASPCLQFELNVSSLPTGAYTYRLLRRSEQVEQGRVLIQHQE